MRPTSRDLIESIIAAIDATILPAVAEKQAASSLRAARTLLEHLAVRVEVEPEVLAADNRDAEGVLAGIGERLPDAPTETGVRALGARNALLQRLVDQRLRAMPIAGRESDEDAAVRAALREYLKRRHARERDMIFPAFLGTPF